MGASPTRPKVLEFLQRNADQKLFATDIASTLDLELRQVQNAVTNSIRQRTANAEKHLEILIRGNQFIWHSEPMSNPQSEQCGPLYEQVKVLKDGAILLQDEKGNLYHAYALFEE